MHFLIYETVVIYLPWFDSYKALFQALVGCVCVCWLRDAFLLVSLLTFLSRIACFGLLLDEARAKFRTT